MGQAIHHRVLIIDDNESIHHDFKTVLEAKPHGHSTLDDLEGELFGDPSAAEDATDEIYDVESAHQGQEGCEKARVAAAAGVPFSLAFVDMRMPPGWDGLATIEHLWEADPTLQIVICSAYSDYSWSEIDERLGQTGQLMMVKKPFDPDGIREMASRLTRRCVIQRRNSALKNEF